MNHESLLDTIRRLLALAEKNPNEHEAQAAAAKAAELMRRHQIERSQVESAASDWVEEVVEEFRRVPLVVHVVSYLLDRHFFVESFYTHRRRAITGRSEIILFGKRENVAVAAYTYHVLLRIFRELLRGRSGAEAQIYLCGLRDGFEAAIVRARRNETVQEERQTNALLAQQREDLRQALLSHGVQIQTTKCKSVYGDPESYEQGKRDGAEITVATPLAASADATPRRLLAN